MAWAPELALCAWSCDWMSIAHFVALSTLGNSMSAPSPVCVGPPSQVNEYRPPFRRERVASSNIHCARRSGWVIASNTFFGEACTKVCRRIVHVLPRTIARRAAAFELGDIASGPGLLAHAFLTKTTLTPGGQCSLEWWVPQSRTKQSECVVGCSTQSVPRHFKEERWAPRMVLWRPPGMAGLLGSRYHKLKCYRLRLKP
jgi:hypothetical protein